MHVQDRVVDDQSKAVYKVWGDKLETDAPVVKVSTAAGKVLKGVWVPDRAIATAVDRFTWKPKGQDNYFVRIKHVIRPLDGPTTMLSKRPNNDANGTAAQAGAGGAVSKADANKVIARAVRAIGLRVPGITFQVVDNFHGLPDFVQAEIIAPKTGLTDGVILGAYRNGVVYVVLDAHKSKEALQEKVVHELYEHVRCPNCIVGAVHPQLANLFTQLGRGRGRRQLHDI